MKKNVLIGSLIASMVVGAASPALADKETIGNIIGGVIGGAIGSKIGKGNGNKAAIIIGAIAGAVIGGELGEDLDEADRREFERAQREGLRGELGDRSDWRGRRGAYGSFTTTREGYNRRGEYCREYVNVIHSRGRTEENRGIACTRRDGSWYEERSTEVTFNRGRIGHDRPGRYPGVPSRPEIPSRPSLPTPPSYGVYSNYVEVRGIARRSGGEWVRVSLVRPLDLSEIEVRTLGAGLRIHEAVAYARNGRRIQIRGLSNSYDLRHGDVARSYGLEGDERRITTIDLRVESMGGYADIHVTVTSDDDRPLLRVSRF